MMKDAAPKTVSEVLQSAVAGDRLAAAELLPLVYAELKRMAQSRMAKLPPGQTIQATALVHEAYMKLVGDHDPGWDGRNHFFGAAARAMRDILVDQARRRGSLKRGGDRKRVEPEAIELSVESPTEDLVALDEALKRLEADDPRKAEIVTLRYFGGLSREETAAALGLTTRTIDREWRYIIARLHMELSGD